MLAREASPMLASFASVSSGNLGKRKLNVVFELSVSPQHRNENTTPPPFHKPGDAADSFHLDSIYFGRCHHRAKSLRSELPSGALHESHQQSLAIVANLSDHNALRVNTPLGANLSRVDITNTGNCPLVK